MERNIYKPVAKVTFYTEEADLVARSTNPGSDVDGDIVSIKTTREMGADAPTFSINLTRRKEWDKYIGSNDLLVIEMVRPPQANKKVFYGLVDDARKNTVVSGNSVQRVISITGRGFSKAFVEFTIGYVPEAEPIEMSVGWLQKNGVVLAGSTGDKIIDAVWENIAKETMNYKWRKNKRLLDIARRKLSFRKNTTLLNDVSLMNWQGSMWSFMKKVADEPFHEIFWEIEDNKPTLILRPTPFNKEDWDKLERFSINDADVVSDGVGKSDVETYSLFSVGMETAFSKDDISKTTGIIPLWNEEFAGKYGIKRLDEDTMYSVMADSEDADGVGELLKQYQIDLYNWYIKNNSFYNGSLIVRGDNRYKVGTRLLYQSEEDNITREYYIKSVSHTFVNYGQWATELGVIRGIEPSKRFSSPVYEHEEYSGMGLTIYDPEAAKANYSLFGIDSISPRFQGIATDVISVAKSLLGDITYTFGGPGIESGRADCSQFTQYCYRKGAGIELGRTTGTQVTKGTKLGTERDGLLIDVNMGLAEPGDLVFFKGTYNSTHLYGVSHVGIYLGDDKMINLNSRGVVIDSVFGSDYWKRHFLMFRRVLNNDTAWSSGAVEGGSGGRTYSMVASAYGGHKINVMGGPGFVPTWTTKSGTKPLEGRTIAVDPDVIPLGTRVRVTCSEYPSVNGEYIAEDIGGAIQGNRIDIYFNDHPPYNPYKARERMLKFGKRHVKVTVLG